MRRARAGALVGAYNGGTPVGCGTGALVERADESRGRRDGGRDATGARAPGGAVNAGKQDAGGLCCAGDGGRDKGAGLPEQEDLFQAGEDAGEDGRDQGVQGSGHACPTCPRRGAGSAKGGELGAQRGGLLVHSPAY